MPVKSGIVLLTLVAFRRAPGRYSSRGVVLENARPIYLVSRTRATVKEALVASQVYLSDWAGLLNPFTTGNQFLGTKLLGNSIRKGFGPLKGLTPVQLEIRFWREITWN